MKLILLLTWIKLYQIKQIFTNIYFKGEFKKVKVKALEKKILE